MQQLPDGPPGTQFGDITRLSGPSPQIYQYEQMTLAAYLDSLDNGDPKYYAARLELQVVDAPCHIMPHLRCAITLTVTAVTVTAGTCKMKEHAG